MFTTDWTNRDTTYPYVYVGNYRDRWILSIPKQVNKQGGNATIELDEENRLIRLVFNVNTLSSATRRLCYSGPACHFWFLTCKKLIEWIYENVDQYQEVLDYKHMHYRFPYTIIENGIIIDMKADQ